MQDIKQVIHKLKKTPTNRWIPLLILTQVLFIGSLLTWSNQSKISSRPQIQTDKNSASTPNYEKLISMIGVVRTSGISQYDYQVTDLNRYHNLNGVGYYVINKDLKDFIGKCVQVIGIEGQYKDNYGRYVVDVYKVNPLSPYVCEPYHDNNENMREKQVSFRGTVTRLKRSNPYSDDYAISVSEELLDKMGYTERSENFNLSLEPASNKVWRDLEENIDKEVLITGVPWGGTPNPDTGNGTFYLTSVRSLVLGHDAPGSVYIEQAHTLNGIDYAFFKDQDAKGKTTVRGILYADKKGGDWRIFTVLKDLSLYINYLHFMDYQNDTLYVLLANTSGAGSGEGVGKLMSLATGSKTWKLETCFEFTGYDGFEPIFESTKKLPEAVKRYLSENPQNAKVSEDRTSQCSDFRLVQQ